MLVASEGMAVSRRSRMVVGMGLALVPLPVAFAVTRSVWVAVGVGLVGLVAGVLLIARGGDTAD